MDKVGALVWEQLQAGHSLEGVITVVARQYDVTPDQAELNVRELLQELIQENLVVPFDNGNAPSVEATPQSSDKLPYEFPKLNIYRDMGDLLALDPPVPGLGDTPWKEPEEFAK